VDASAFSYCNRVLNQIKTKKEQTTIDSDTLEDAIHELNTQTYQLSSKLHDLHCLDIIIDKGLKNR
jgi:chaperonin cofactor prefoldin